MKKNERLDKILANMGYGTRSELRKKIKAGYVKIDEKIVNDPGFKVNPLEQSILFDGVLVEYRTHVYFMLHKPQGVISATTDSQHQTVIDLLQPQDRILQPFPVGRLDKDTEGLLILTNDGPLAHELLSPKKDVPKTYVAHVRGLVNQDDVQAFQVGVQLDDGYTTKPAQLKIVQIREDGEMTISDIQLTIVEGKFHQVKRMFRAVGKEVLYLKRISMGPLKLDATLPLGQYRELTQEELHSLQ